MEKVIAERKLLFSEKGSSVRKEFIIRIRAPYWDDEFLLGACTLELDGLPVRSRDVRGTDLLQALELAVNLDSFLMALQKKKYDFYWPTGEPYLRDPALMQRKPHFMRAWRVKLENNIMEKVIAERKLLFSEKGSSVRKEFIIRIHAPYWDDELLGACAVELDGLPVRSRDVRGMDLLQALELATNVDSFLKTLQKKKYDFYWSTGEQYFYESEQALIAEFSELFKQRAKNDFGIDLFNI